MARKKLKQPIDSKTKEERKKIKEHPHFDFDCDVFSEKHYGTYLIVKNSSKADAGRQHNRFYIDTEKELEFLLKTGYGHLGLTAENHKCTDAHLFSIYPTYTKLIETLISKIKRSEKRNSVRDILYGINTIISLFEKSNISLPNHPNDFRIDIHQKYISDAILEGKITTQNRIKNLGMAWSYIRKFFDNSALGTLPSQCSAETQIESLIFQEEEEEDEISLEILFQLDYYSQIELNRIIERAKEYRKWMKELDTYGELFSRANLLKTYFNNSKSKMLRNLYILLYKEDPQCWDPYIQNRIMIDGKIKFVKGYACKADEVRHQKLIVISEKGIDISIKDEKMFAWWHKILFPEWPFNKTVAKPYDTIFISSGSWLTHQSKAAGISLKDFHERIFPEVNIVYLMYLRLLIDSTANTDVVSNIEVHKMNDGAYRMGEIHHNLRMLNSVKTRSNSVTPSFIAKGTFTDKCINYFTEWLTPIYDRSDNNAFLQYVNSSGKIHKLDSEKVKALNPKSSQRKKFNGEKRSFFERYEIYKSIEKIITTKENVKERVLQKERIWWIKHMNIRPANNFKNYHLLYGEWVRAHVTLGQQSDQIEKLNYRKFSWKLGDEHQTAISLLNIQNFIEGKVIDKKLDNVFEQPHCGCKDNANPSFDGAPKINDGEVCTSWRYCLTRCENSYVFPEYHAPAIMAWKMVMDQEYERFIRTEDWTKEYGEDYEAAEIVISCLKPEDLEFAKSKAAEWIPFVRLMMMQTKQKRKVKETINE